ADGEIIPARIIHRVDFDHAGRPRPSRTLVLDMRQPDAASEESDPLRLARFINNAPIGIATASADGRITMLNAALAQITTEARLGGSIAAIVPPADREKLMTVFNSVIRGERDQAQTDVNIASGSETRAQITIAATRTGKGDEQELSATLYIIDTTLHQALMQQLEQGQKMQAVGKLVSGIAHDFNNMLTAILGYSDMLLQKHRPEDPSFAQIMDIKHNANRAADMVRKLLAFSRKQTLQPGVLSLTDLLSDMVSMLRRIMGEKVRLHLEHGRDLWPVMADASQIDRVIMNLCVNARDAMPRGGEVTIRTRNIPASEAGTVAADVMPEADYVLIEVADTGEGIPPEVLDKIYDPFFTTKGVGKGTGLGLSTVYGVIKQTGGFIFCDSTPGEGTAFSIYLPRHIETEAEKAERIEKARPEPETREDLTGEGRILLAEDEDAVRAFAVHALETRGYTVIPASSGELAVDTMEEMLEKGENVDLVVSDVVMPGMDGPTMMKELRAMGVTAPVVFMSGHAEDAFAESLEEGTEFT
ncbi:MAG TPA: PAS domain-containing sensor histidine kinase, partial [Bryobacterales bacterium]|nr:PAS domain-containing sensor histidine kinase [Bryobacterales bacterium]